MTDLLTDEQLRDMANGYGAMDAYYRAVNELIALRARVAQLEALHSAVCSSRVGLHGDGYHNILSALAVLQTSKSSRRCFND